MTMDVLNQADEAHFMELIGGPLEGQLWLAKKIVPLRPFASVEGLFAAFQQVVSHAVEAEKIALISSHPDLAGKAAIDGRLSALSLKEQAAAGLDRLTPEEYTAFHEANDTYKTKFGFPFVICARENTKTSILAAFKQRLDNTREQEIETGVGEVLKILRLRLVDLFG